MPVDGEEVVEDIEDDHDLSEFDVDGVIARRFSGKN